MKLKYASLFSENFKKNENYEFFKKSFDSMEDVLNQAINLSPFSNKNGKNCFHYATEKTWVTYFATAATLAHHNQITFSIENGIYDSKSNSKGRSDLLISYKKISDKSPNHILVEGKLTEWQAGVAWRDKKIAKLTFDEIFSQANDYAKHISPEPTVFGIYFDWYKNSDDKQKLEKADKFFTEYNVNAVEVDFLINFQTLNEGVFVFGKGLNQP